MPSLPELSDGIALTRFIVAADVERSARFYSGVLGGEIVLGGEPTIVALAIGTRCSRPCPDRIKQLLRERPPRWVAERVA
jgi:hypothetical protein